MFRQNIGVVILVVVAILYLFFGLAWLSLPGPYQDELLFLNVAFPPNFLSWHVGKVRIFDSTIPTMIMPYVGALKGWMWRGIFSFWEASIYSVRAPAVFLGAIALWFFYLFSRRLYGAATAVVAVAIAALDPGYIFTVRLDWGPVVLAHVFSCAGLLFGTYWLLGRHPKVAEEEQRLGWLAGAGFCFGLGLWDKALFAWFLGALGMTLLLLFPRDVWRRIRPTTAAVFLIAFLFGALPLIIYNTAGRATRTASLAEVETLSLERMSQKLQVLKGSLDTRFVYFWTGGYEMPDESSTTVSDATQLLLTSVSRMAPASGTLLPWALIGAALIAAVAGGARRAILFPLLISGLMWTQMLPLKTAGGGPHHWVLAYPLPHLGVAAAGIWLWQRHRARIPAVLALVALLASQLGWSAAYLAMFRETGGRWLWSDAFYELSAYLEEHQPAMVVSMDWGLTYPVLLLTQGRIQQNDFYAQAAFGPSSELPSRMQELAKLLAQPNTLFLFQAEGRESFPSVRAEFERALATTGSRKKSVRSFHQKNGKPAAELFAVIPGPNDGTGMLGPPAQLSFLPEETSPGDRYVIESPDLSGHYIDLKYRFDGRAPEIALQFCKLDGNGRAIVRVPLSMEPVIVEVLAVRISDTQEWRPTAAQLRVR